MHPRHTWRYICTILSESLTAVGYTLAYCSIIIIVISWQVLFIIGLSVLNASGSYGSESQLWDVIRIVLRLYIFCMFKCCSIFFRGQSHISAWLYLALRVSPMISHLDNQDNSATSHAPVKYQFLSGSNFQVHSMYTHANADTHFQCLIYIYLCVCVNIYIYNLMLSAWCLKCLVTSFAQLQLSAGFLQNRGCAEKIVHRDHYIQVLQQGDAMHGHFSHRFLLSSSGATTVASKGRNYVWMLVQWSFYDCCTCLSTILVGKCSVLYGWWWLMMNSMMLVIA